MRQHTIERGADEERFDAHLGQPRHRAGRIVGVQRREHEVTGERGLDGDLRGLVVADLTDEYDVRVRTQDRTQRARERQAGLDVRLDLVDPRHAVLDGVLNGDDVDLRLADDVERRVKSC